MRILIGLVIAALACGQDRGRELVRAGIAAMGGEAALRAVKTVRIEGIGYTNLLEQSERPEGPWLQAYALSAEFRDLAGPRVWWNSSNRTYNVEKWPDPINRVVVKGTAAMHGGARWAAGSETDLKTAAEKLALGPERVLLTAIEAVDLHAEADIRMQDVPHHVVAFTWNKHGVRLILNAHTRLPTAMELKRAYPLDTFWNLWGDVTTRTLYSLWELQKGGVLYPRQWDIERNGQPYQTVTLTKLELNTASNDADFAIPEDTAKAFAGRTVRMPESVPLGPGKEIAPGVINFTGSWNTTLIKQGQGVVVLEAVISSGHAAKVVDEAGRRFPGVPIVAAISTSDAWPHLAGVREYVARGIPVYILDANQAILDRVVRAPRTEIPDALGRAPRVPVWRVVNGKTVIGNGANRIELYPVRGESGERMMVAWFPDLKLLYASDLIQHDRNGAFFMPEYLQEVITAVTREKLAPVNVFAMHLEVIPWDEVTRAVERAKAN